VEGYVDTARRADLVDKADAALRRIGRDLRLALPNSVRVQGTCDGTAACLLEFIPTVAGGRYRAEIDSSDGSGNILDFTGDDANSGFDILGPAITVPANAWLVVYNLGLAGADAYSGDSTAADNRRAATAAASTTSVAFSPATRLPFDSPARRFQIVQQPVTYACNPGAGTITRHWDYGFNAAQAAPAGGSSARLVDGVSSCAFVYEAAAVAQRSGVVAMSVQLTQGGETANLFQQTHVSNIP
jgi:MSHA biogenesis protein MshO